MAPKRRFCAACGGFDPSQVFGEPTKALPCICDDLVVRKNQVEYVVDPQRHKILSTETGIYIRATLEGKWGPYDLMHLDRESVLAWLRNDRQQDPASPRSRAEQTVLILLGHPH